MRPIRQVFPFLALIVLVVVTAGAPRGASARPVQDAADQQSEGVFLRVCSNCHPIARVTATRRTRGQWEETMETMISTRGARVTDEEFDVILAYLAREHGRVNANTAPADEIVEVLGIPDKMAE